MAILILLKLTIFVGVIIFFGWQFVRFVLNEPRKEFLIPLSVTAGSVIYIFILNALGYLLDITRLFAMVLGGLLLIGLGLWLRHRKQTVTVWSLDKKWQKIFMVTILGLFTTTGLIAARGFAGDEINI